MLNQNEMLIVSKYFDKINDYINIIKTCKEYNEILNLLNYNPIPLNSKNYKFFTNLQTYHIYNKKHFKDFEKYDKISKINWCIVNYNIYLMFKNKEDILKMEFKNIILTKNNLNNLNNLNIIEFGKYCFNDCFKLKEISIPNTVTKLGKYCFNNCENLEEIKLPERLKEIGDYCFWNCRNLKEIIVPNTVTRIGNGNFLGCRKLTRLTLPEQFTNHITEN